MSPKPVEHVALEALRVDCQGKAGGTTWKSSRDHASQCFDTYCLSANVGGLRRSRQVAVQHWSQRRGEGVSGNIDDGAANCSAECASRRYLPFRVVLCRLAESRMRRGERLKGNYPPCKACIEQF